MIDNHTIEAAYVVLVFVSWLWALSQLWAAIQYPTIWRGVVALWMVTKASFFTMAACIWWFNWFDEMAFTAGIYALAGVHIVLLLAWLRPPKGQRQALDEKRGT